VFQHILKSKKVKKSNSHVFFVRGFQRSGTNWVCNLLNLHPEITCVGEFHFKHFFNAQQELLKQPFVKQLNKGSWLNDEFTKFIENMVKEHAGYNKWCGDRTPCAIDDVLVSNRKYIVIHRDGRDCLISWIYHLFRLNAKFGVEMGPKKELFKKDPEYFEKNKKKLLNKHWTKKVATEWNRRVLQDLKTIESVDSKELNIEYKFVRYEDLVANTELIRRDFYRFIGLVPEKAKALNEKTSPGFNKHQPNEHNRIGKPLRWKEYFTDEQIEWFEEIAFEALTKLNYTVYSKQKQKV